MAPVLFVRSYSIAPDLTLSKPILKRWVGIRVKKSPACFFSKPAQKLKFFQLDHAIDIFCGVFRYLRAHGISDALVQRKRHRFW